MPEDKLPSEKLAPETFPTEGVSTIYANLASITVSYSDIRLYFCEICPSSVALTPSPSVKEPRLLKAAIRPQVSVVMSPEQMKVFATGLMTSLQQFEEQFGPIRPPKHVIDASK